jgi:hypothetical protein
MLHELFAFPWTGWSFTWPPVVGAYLDCMARQLGHGVALVRSNGKARHDLGLASLPRPSSREPFCAGVALSVIWFIIASGVWYSSGYAEPNKVEYELQERCGKRGAEVFKNEYSSVSNTKDGQSLNNYRSHYSPVLNKCFFLEMIYTIAARANPQYSTQMYEVVPGPGTMDRRS